MAFASLHQLLSKPSTVPWFLPPPKCLALLSLFSTSLSDPSPPAAAKRTFSHIFQHCAQHPDPHLGREAHSHMITCGFAPTTFVANCLVHMYIRCSKVDDACKVFDQMPHKDTVSWNAMLSGYARNGMIGTAKSFFGAMPERDVISWNVLISGCARNGDSYESLDLFLQMERSGIDPDRTTFAVVLKSCAALEELGLGVQIHGVAVKAGLDSDVVAGSALVDMYAKCKSLSDSLRFFYEMPERNWVSWSVVIGGCVQNEQFGDGLKLFMEMQQVGVEVSQSAYASVFRACAGLPSLRAGSQLHGHAFKNNFSNDVVVGTSILDMYAKCDSLDDAMRVFQWLPTRSLQSWNAVIVGFARNGRGLEAMELFQLMNGSGVGVDEISLSAVFGACAEVKGHFGGMQVHCLAIKTNLISDICVRNAVLDMYGKCKSLVEAYNIFEEMEQRDAVSWNAIITALEQNGKYEETLLLFNQMLHYGMEPDEFTYGSVLKACAGLQSLDYGLKVHDKIIKSGLGLDLFIGSALVDMYCKCGMIKEAQKIHGRIDKEILISWNAIITGFSLQKESEEAQNVFFEMLDIGLRPDNFTYASVLDTCANLATIGLGKQIHAQVIKQELQRDVYVASTLMDMYAKCGHMQDSLQMFDKMQERDFVSWNGIISGYAHHGLGVEAVKMFERMQLENIRPNHATFVAVLRACGHVGLVQEGMHYFHLMTDHYKLEPQLEHYSCMVDIVGRSRGTSEALKLISDMPFEPDAVIWRTLLNVCKIQRNVEVAELAASNILLSDPEDSAAYVLLSNIYAEVGKWGEVSKLRRIMRQGRLKKEPGCSWIEVKSEMHTFFVGDKAHPRCSEIYERLDELISEMKRSGYVPNIDSFFEDKEEERSDQHELLGFGNG